MPEFRVNSSVQYKECWMRSWKIDLNSLHCHGCLAGTRSSNCVPTGTLHKGESPSPPTGSPRALAPLLELQRHSLQEPVPGRVGGIALGPTQVQGPIALPSVLCLHQPGVEVAAHTYRVLHRRGRRTLASQTPGLETCSQASPSPRLLPTPSVMG